MDEGGGAPRPKEPLTTRGLSPSLSNLDRRLLRSAWGTKDARSRSRSPPPAFDAFAAAPVSKAAILDLREEVVDDDEPVATPLLGLLMSLLPLGSLGDMVCMCVRVYVCMWALSSSTLQSSVYAS